MMARASVLTLISALAASAIITPALADDSAPIVASCNNGALEVVRNTDLPDAYEVRVNDAGVAQYLIAQSQTSFTTLVDGSPYGSPQPFEVTVTRNFPWMVRASEDGKKLVIVDFHRYEDNRFLTSGPGGVRLEPYANGLRLEIGGGHMPGSHSVVYYTVGEWFFESCSIAQ